MKFRDFQLPHKIEWLEESNEYGKFFCEPFERGYGHTIGNSIRRILLSSMEGAAITSIKIEGVSHEYSTIKGVKEDVLELIFNLKQHRFRLYTDESQQISLEVTGEREITGKDFKLNPSIKLLNPSAKIATLSEDGKLNLEATVEKGRGYLLASDQQEENSTIGEIPVDASFSPIKKVHYNVENSRVGQATDYDKLILEVWTDGNIKPSEAVAYASGILKKTLEVFEIPELEEIELGEGKGGIEGKELEVKNLPLEALKISTRIENLLGRGGIKSIGDLVNKTEKEISEIESLGKKSIDEIKEKMDKLNKDRELTLNFKESPGK